jgi:hypothetical protein
MLTAADAGPVYVPPGYVLFGREGALLAQRFDPGKRKLIGDAVPLARKVSVDPSNNDLFASAGANLLVYQIHSPRNRELTWLDRTGRSLARVGPPAEYWTFALSPDETQIVASIADPERRTGDLWIVDAVRGTRTRLTSGASDEFMPRWATNGSIYYTADPEGFYDVYRMPASGTGNSEKVLHTTLDKWVNDVSRDGGSLLMQVFDLKSVYDLWVLPLESTEGAKPEVTFAAGYPETEGQFSPDGRWIAYASRESGRDEVLVSPRSAPTRRLQISVGGGTQPRWSRDGREIFFLTPERRLMAAAVRLHEDTAEVLDTKPLFSNKDFRLGWDPRVRTTYEVSVDGRFLFPLPVDERDARPLVAVVDWAAGLEKR